VVHLNNVECAASGRSAVGKRGGVSLESAIAAPRSLVGGVVHSGLVDLPFDVLKQGGTGAQFGLQPLNESCRRLEKPGPRALPGLGGCPHGVGRGAPDECS
jgi:hypothetical protein